MSLLRESDPLSLPAGGAVAVARSPRRALPSLGLAAILLAFVALALGYALATPPWNNPDEPAHYNYVRHIVRTGTLPELRPGDWDAQRLEYLKSHRFPPGESIAAIRYESHQPPLYYLLAAPLLVASEPLGEQVSVLALRAFSILLGVGLVFVAYLAAGRALSTDEPEPEPGYRPATRSAVPVLAAGLVAFVPMHTAMSAAVNNDALANLLGGLLVLALLSGLSNGFATRPVVAVGLLAGAVVVTKLTAYALVPLAVTTIALVRLTRSGGLKSPAAWSSAGRAVGLAALATALVAGGWLVRQGTVYGWDDLLASRHHQLVVAGQPRWEDLGVEPLPYFATTLFHSFWAQFGWMGVLVDERLYRLFGLFTLLALLGLGLRLLRRLGPGDPVRPGVAWPPGHASLLLAAACLLVLGGVVYYNLTLVQAQGRYLFPVLVPLAILLALGWQGLATYGRLGRGLAAGWLVAATLDGAGLLLGAPLPVRLVYGAATAGALVTAAVPVSARAWSALTVAPVPVLALLDLVCLARFVAPAFAS